MVAAPPHSSSIKFALATVPDETSHTESEREREKDDLSVVAEGSDCKQALFES